MSPPLALYQIHLMQLCNVSFHLMLRPGRLGGAAGTAPGVRPERLRGYKSAGEPSQVLGMHAVLCIGYDDYDSTFIIVNSHGKRFDKNGTFKMRNDYMLNPELAFELWCINT